ncbi:MAG TPA: DUF4012 domain-containing protein, partial [Actinomycetota bacterium]|nr:DUF4012 domain-containing protein [Actinomycetota bacterium]
RSDEGSESLLVAEAELKDAEQKLSSPLTIPARLVPGIRQNLVATSAITAAGLDMVEAGKAGLKAMQSLPFGEGGVKTIIKEGAVDLGPLISADSFVQRIRAEVRSAKDRVVGSGSSLLLPPVRSARTEMLAMLDDSKSQVDVAAGASFLIPRILGTEGERTWVIAAENIAEARGRGGYLGSLAFLKTAGGKLSLGEFGPTSELPNLIRQSSGLPAEYISHYQGIGGLESWQNLAMSPHFPSAGRVLVRRLAEASIVKADGVISLDPVALSYLLQATGPIAVEGRAEQLDQNNFVDWTLNGQYFEFQSQAAEARSASAGVDLRQEALTGVADAIWKRVLSGENIDPQVLAKALGRGLAERRIALYSSDPQEQDLIERLGMSGRVSPSKSDYLMVVGQNFGENKMDYYLQRDISYEGVLDTSGSLEASVKINIRNTAAEGIEFPGHVGAARPELGLNAGQARSYVETFVPSGARLKRVLLDGKESTDFKEIRELGKKVFITTVTLSPGEQKTVEYSYTVKDAIKDGKYRLVLQNQSTVRPDRLSVDIAVPENSNIEEREGFVRGDRLTWSGDLVADTELAAEVSMPWHLRLPSRVLEWLKRPAIKIGT